MTLARVRARLEAAGLDLHGALAIADYDALVPEAWRAAQLAPGARGALVVGNAGRTLWERFSAAPERALADDPLDTYTRRVLRESAHELAPEPAIAFYADRRNGVYLPIVALARRAGFGSPGKIGVLIHPVFGPWIAIRAVLLVAEALTSEPVRSYAPCDGCPAPCITACHGGAVTHAGSDPAVCYRARLELALCASACDARSACVVGREHAYSREAIAHHSRIRSAPPAQRR